MADQGLATWFHEHLTPFLVAVLRAICQLGSGEWIGIVLFAAYCFLPGSACGHRSPR
jgi:hypothetical protein